MSGYPLRDQASAALTIRLAPACAPKLPIYLPV
jgi:hypothetical protein